eukprot:TRINITY_DN2444_c0_g2_i1.p1 TRINITY_DN2444_c0_g2~~TRINITY_DN2444_c0_g2_i1.p1  ORF type:complete len:470 (-),score=52.48 TRINITY_DN2444_c0_g2_i1:1139-2548(-)
MQNFEANFQNQGVDQERDLADNTEEKKDFGQTTQNIEVIKQVPRSKQNQQIQEKKQDAFCIKLQEPNRSNFLNALITDTVKHLPLVQSLPQNVQGVGPLVEFQRVNDHETDIRVVFGFRVKESEKEQKEVTSLMKLDTDISALHMPCVDADFQDWIINPHKLVLGRRLAVGGFAEVFIGKYEGTVVAIKRLFGENLANDFKQEVDILLRLRHPNLILFIGYCMSQNPQQFVIVSEYMSRGSLWDVIQKQKIQLPTKGQRMIALSVARGMLYLHTRKPPILHLDLKSPNILLDQQWRVKIADFGLSQIMGKGYISHVGVGSPEWSSPEMLRGETVDDKTDVYSYGVVLWELMTGEKPWEGKNSFSIVAQVGYQGQRLDTPLQGDPFLVELFEMCTQQEPQKRPSFKEIMEMWELQYAENQEILGLPPVQTSKQLLPQIVQVDQQQETEVQRSTDSQQNKINPASQNQQSA